MHFNLALALHWGTNKCMQDKHSAEGRIYHSHWKILVSNVFEKRIQISTHSAEKDEHFDGNFTT